MRKGQQSLDGLSATEAVMNGFWLGMIIGIPIGGLAFAAGYCSAWYSDNRRRRRDD